MTSSTTDAEPTGGSKRLALPSTMRLQEYTLVAVIFVLLVVGTLSLALPDVFQHPTVWSMFGVGYLFIPVALPIVGMWWLLKHRPEGSS